MCVNMGGKTVVYALKDLYQADPNRKCANSSHLEINEKFLQQIVTSSVKILLIVS